MGGKQWKNRKHLLFYGACVLIVLILTEGCVIPSIPSRRVQVLPEGGTPMEKASMMESKGSYDEAFKAYGNIARSYPREYPGDQALFRMGLILVYPGYPKKNYEEALKYFQRLLHDFPRSSLKEEARSWSDVLNRLNKHDGQVKELEGKIISDLEQINMLKGQVNTLEEQIDSYKKQISALKEIDIGIEEKKRKGLPEE